MTESRSFAEVAEVAEAVEGPLFAQEAEGVEDADPALDPAAVFAQDRDNGARPPVGGHVDSGARRERFDGDTSALPAEVCWALQELVAAPHVTDKARRHWPIVLQYEEVLRSRLAELGLILEINHEHRYAFTRQADDPSPHSRSLLRTKTLSLAASALALYVYQQYMIASGDPVVAVSDMVDHMMAYKRADDTDEAAFQKRVLGAVKSLEDAAVIKQIRGTDRYLVYSVITSVLTADRIDALRGRYLAIAHGDGPSAAATQGEDGDD